jgi:hypothetical protein
MPGRGLKSVGIHGIHGIHGIDGIDGIHHSWHWALNIEH